MTEPLVIVGPSHIPVTPQAPAFVELSANPSEAQTTYCPQFKLQVETRPAIFVGPSRIKAAPCPALGESCNTPSGPLADAPLPSVTSPATDPALTIRYCVVGQAAKSIAAMKVVGGVFMLCCGALFFFLLFSPRGRV